MKRLSVTLKLEMEIPDDWMVDTTSDGIETLKMGDGRYLDLGLEPLCFDDRDENRICDPDEDFLKSTLLMVRNISTELKMDEGGALPGPVEDAARGFKAVLPGQPGQSVPALSETSPA